MTKPKAKTLRSKIFDYQYGLTRKVFLVGPWAIKIPNWRHNKITLQLSHTYVSLFKSWPYEYGFIANKNEAKIYYEYKLWDDLDEKALLCPVLWCSKNGSLLIMKRVDRVLENNHGGVDLGPWITAEYEDIKPDNFGYLNDKLVMIDYGGYDSGW